MGREGQREKAEALSSLSDSVQASTDSQQSGNASVSSESFTYAGKGLHLSDNALEVHNSSGDL